MNWDQTLMLMVKLSGFKLMVRANRLGCNTDLARDAHDMLIECIDEFRADLERVTVCWRELLGESDPDKADYIAYDLRDQRSRVAHFWLESNHRYVLGGWRRAGDAGDFHLPDTFDYELFATRHWVRELADAELCGLRPILDQLAEETGMTIPAVVIYYDPGQKTWTERPIEPFDPDAPIPW